MPVAGRWPAVRRTGSQGPGRLRAALAASAAAALLLAAGCSTPAFQPSARPATHAHGQPAASPLARYFGIGPSTQTTALRLLDSGHEAFAARAALAALAGHTLDLQYHIIEHDDTAILLLQQLLRAADRGVRVRLLVDDLGVQRSEADLAVLSRHRNIEVRLFNPFHWRGVVSRAMEWLGSDKRLNQRMHNKLWIADNAAAVIGGRNLGDAYFDATPAGGFADLDLLVTGPAVQQASASFDLYWNSAWAVALADVVDVPADTTAALRRLNARADAFRGSDYARTLRATELVRQLRQSALAMTPAAARVLADIPPEPQLDADERPAPAKTGTIFPALRAAVAGIRQEMLLVTPYFVPGARSVEVLCTLPARGVAVRVLTNSLASTDVPAVHAGYARYRKALLACGVQLSELRPAGGTQRPRLSSRASLHAKAVVIDRRWVLMGSMNLDARSRLINTEVALQVDSETLGAQLGAMFDASTTPDQVWRPVLAVAGDAASALHWQGLEGGQAVTLEHEPEAGAWRQALSALLGWLIDEELL